MIAVVVMACVNLQVSEVKVGEYTKLRISYVSSCTGNLKIVVKFESPIFSIEGNVIGKGNEVILETYTFPQDTGGFDVTVVGKPKAKIYVYLNGYLIEKYLVGECFSAGASYSRYDLMLLGYQVPKNVYSIGITLVNMCKKDIKVWVSVKGKEGLKPLVKVPAIRCVKSKEYVKMVRTCVESVCTHWEVINYVCSKREIRCRLVYDPILKEKVVKCKSNCLERSPVYSCTSSRCSRTELVPKVERVCVERVREILNSNMVLSDGKFYKEVRLRPGEVVQLHAFFKGETENVLATVQIDGSSEVLKVQEEGYASWRINWPFLLISLGLITIAVALFFLT